MTGNDVSPERLECRVPGAAPNPRLRRLNNLPSPVTVADMITFLEGTLEEKQATRIVLNVGGVGYEVFISLTSFDQLPKLGETTRILIHDYIREDAHSLYGFMREKERTMFLLLLGITGIGPKIALSALSGMPVRDLTAAAAEGDIKRLSSISGVGKKMAERIAVELRHKISQADILEATAGAEDVPEGDSRMRDVLMALVALGYKQADAQKLARDAVGRSPADASVEELIRIALVKG